MSIPIAIATGIVLGLVIVALAGEIGIELKDGNW